jgi:hypothetical protein
MGPMPPGQPFLNFRILVDLSSSRCWINVKPLDATLLDLDFHCLALGQECFAPFCKLSAESTQLNETDSIVQSIPDIPKIRKDI